MQVIFISDKKDNVKSEPYGWLSKGFWEGKILFFFKRKVITQLLKCHVSSNAFKNEYSNEVRILKKKGGIKRRLKNSKYPVTLSQCEP